MESFDEGKAKRNGHEIAVHCVVVNAPKSEVFGTPHYHEYIELLYGLSGETEIWMGGRILRFSKNDLVVVNSREHHTLRGISGNKNEYIVVKLMPQLLYAGEESVFELKYLLPFVLDDNDHQRLFTSKELEASPIDEMMKDILHEWRSQQYGYELAIRSDILRVFLWIQRYWHIKNINAISKKNIPGTLNEAIQKSVEYANKNYRTVTCNEVAEYCGLSYSYFCRSFKRVMNMSFTDYVNYVRISAAQKLVITTDMAMGEIADNVGFSTASYFIEQFKKYKNMSPKQFRMSVLQQLGN